MTTQKQWTNLGQMLLRSDNGYRMIWANVSRLNYIFDDAVMTRWASVSFDELRFLGFIDLRVQMRIWSARCRSYHEGFQRSHLGLQDLDLKWTSEINDRKLQFKTVS